MKLTNFEQDVLIVFASYYPFTVQQIQQAYIRVNKSVDSLRGFLDIIMNISEKSFDVLLNDFITSGFLKL